MWRGHGNAQFHHCLISIICPVLLWGQAAWQDVQISAVVDQQSIYEMQPLKVLVSINHNKNAKVDAASFRIGGKTIKVEFIQDVQISPISPLVLSYYRFTLPGQPVGLYELPEITVKVGGKVYSSIASTYQVEPLKEKPAARAPSPVPYTPPTPVPAPAPHLRLLQHLFLFRHPIYLLQPRLPKLPLLLLLRLFLLRPRLLQLRRLNLQQHLLKMF